MRQQQVSDGGMIEIQGSTHRALGVGPIGWQYDFPEKYEVT